MTKTDVTNVIRKINNNLICTFTFCIDYVHITEYSDPQSGKRCFLATILCHILRGLIGQKPFINLIFFATFSETRCLEKWGGLM